MMIHPSPTLPHQALPFMVKVTTRVWTPRGLTLRLRAGTQRCVSVRLHLASILTIHPAVLCCDAQCSVGATIKQYQIS